MDESGFTSQLRYAFDTMTGTLAGAIAVFCWLLLLVSHGIQSEGQVGDTGRINVVFCRRILP